MQHTAPLRTYIPPSTTSYIPTYAYVRPLHTYPNTAHAAVSKLCVSTTKVVWVCALVIHVIMNIFLLICDAARKWERKWRIYFAGRCFVVWDVTSLWCPTWCDFFTKQNYIVLYCFFLIIHLLICNILNVIWWAVTSNVKIREDAWTLETVKCNLS